MKVAAPGKLMLSGAYVVLEGAPTIVMAVARYAVADADVLAEPSSAEAKQAFVGQLAPTVDVGQMYRDGKKLGVGSSAASLVAQIGAARAAKGEDLKSADVRASIFAEARAAHARAQSGGSGYDVAASTFGGVLRYELPNGATGADVRMSAGTLPAGLHIDAWFTSTSARTSDLLAKVAAFAARDARGHRRCFDDLTTAAHAIADGVASASPYAIVRGARRSHAALVALGEASGAPIVPAAVAELAAIAERSGDAFFVSGAGGGDVALRIALTPQPDDFAARAREVGFHPLPISVDTQGVHVASASSSS